jgi:trehalose-6-phosphatase
MIVEAMPRCASKARAVEMLKARKPPAFATIYCGDDSTDEDAFAALGDDDVSVLVGAPRVTHAIYRLPDPAALAVEISQLAEVLTRADDR